MKAPVRSQISLAGDSTRHLEINPKFNVIDRNYERTEKDGVLVVRVVGR